MFDIRLVDIDGIDLHYLKNVHSFFFFFFSLLIISY